MLIGITGGIGSGQSTVVKMFAKLGAKVIIADKLAREIMEPGQPGYEAILKVFGKTYLTTDKRINRRKLGALVFGSKKQLRLLNKTIHPILIKRIKQEINRLQKRYQDKRCKPLLMLEAAILFETKMERLVDYVIVVYAPKSTRIKRIKQRDKLTVREIKSRFAAQIPLDQKLKKTKYIIDNSGRISTTFKQVENFYSVFLILSQLKDMINKLERMQ
jgi:dephospho-CoA kinase